jgi:hypothetical protein
LVKFAQQRQPTPRAASLTPRYGIDRVAHLSNIGPSRSDLKSFQQIENASWTLNGNHRGHMMRIIFP